MLRVVRMATDLGIEALGSPTPTSPSDLDARAARRRCSTSSGPWPAYFAGAGHLIDDSAATDGPEPSLESRRTPRDADDRAATPVFPPWRGKTGTYTPKNPDAMPSAPWRSPRRRTRRAKVS